MSSTNAEKNATFYNDGASVEEKHAGYLYKSPPPGLMNKKNSWKRRFFVLAKKDECTHELRYYRNAEKDTAIKSIDVSTISTLLNTCPEEHPALDWICRNFKCSPSSVLFMKAQNPKDKVEREYFFIGEESGVTDGWFNALLQVQMQTEPMSQPVPPSTNEAKSTDHNTHETDQSDHAPPLPPKKRMSAPDGFKTQHNECDQSPGLPASEVKLDETARDSSGDKWLSSGRESAASIEGSLLDSVTEAFDNLKTKQTSNERKKTQSETFAPVKEEICVHLDHLKNLIFTEETGKPCVSKCSQIEATCLLHKGDQILAINDLLTDTVEDIQIYLRKLNKHEVKLTILRHTDSIPLRSDLADHV